MYVRKLERKKIIHRKKLNLCDNSGVSWGGGGLNPQRAPPPPGSATDVGLYSCRSYTFIGPYFLLSKLSAYIGLYRVTQPQMAELTWNAQYPRKPSVGSILLISFLITFSCHVV